MQFLQAVEVFAWRASLKGPSLTDLSCIGAKVSHHNLTHGKQRKRIQHTEPCRSKRNPAGTTGWFLGLHFFRTFQNRSCFAWVLAMLHPLPLRHSQKRAPRTGSALMHAPRPGTSPEATSVGRLLFLFFLLLCHRKCLSHGFLLRQYHDFLKNFIHEEVYPWILKKCTNSKIEDSVSTRKPRICQKNFICINHPLERPKAFESKSQSDQKISQQNLEKCQSDQTSTKKSGKVPKWPNINQNIWKSAKVTKHQHTKSGKSAKVTKHQPKHLEKCQSDQTSTHKIWKSAKVTKHQPKHLEKCQSDQTSTHKIWKKCQSDQTSTKISGKVPFEKKKKKQTSHLTPWLLIPETSLGQATVGFRRQRGCLELRSLKKKRWSALENLRTVQDILRILGNPKPQTQKYHLFESS